MKKIMPPVALLAVLSLALTARAQITLAFVYNSTTGNTVASYTGNWNGATFTPNGTNSGALFKIDPSFFAAEPVGSTSISSGVPLFGTAPWNTVTADSGTGDFLAFTGDIVYAQGGYTSGSPLAGSLTFVGKGLAALGFDASEIANGGVLGSGGTAVTWSASAIPEPSTYALCCGCLALGYVVFSRSVRREKWAEKGQVEVALI